MTFDEMKQILAETIRIQNETSRKVEEHRKENQEQQEIQRKEVQELRAAQKKDSDEVNQQLRELGRQIGGLGNKIGSFTEGLALPSMQKILQRQFRMEVISPSVRVRKNGREIEIDVLAYANSAINEVYIVEVKSHLREEGIIQLQKLIKNFRTFFPEHRDKKVFGIIAAIDMPKTLKKRALALGLYTAIIHEEIFSIEVPKRFIAKAY